jgi:hypothetical protein
MKRFLVAAVCAGAALFAAGTAEATITFQIDQAASSVSVSHAGIGWADVDGSLVGGLGNNPFSLDEGGSQTFDFFELGGTGLFGAGVYNVTATLAFLTPPGTGPVTGDGGGLYVTVFGALNLGTLTWTTMPKQVALADGSIVEVDFGSGFDARLGPVPVTATVRLVEEVTAVPEPATLLLMVGALVGLSAIRRGSAA